MENGDIFRMTNAIIFNTFKYHVFLGVSVTVYEVAGSIPDTSTILNVD